MIYRYQDLYPMLKVELPGCPEPLILQELQRIGRNFCIDTEAWQEKLSLINLVAAQTDYPLVHVFEADIQRIVYVRIGTDDDSPDDDTADTDPNQYNLVVGSTTGILNVLRFRDALKPPAAVTNGLLVKVVLVPRAFASELAPWFMERWVEGIIAGVLGNLKAQKGKTWSDPKNVLRYMIRYEQYRTRAMREAYHAYKGGSLLMQGVPFF